MDHVYRLLSNLEFPILLNFDILGQLPKETKNSIKKKFKFYELELVEKCENLLHYQDNPLLKFSNLVMHQKRR
jgi:hypothetical protein